MKLYTEFELAKAYDKGLHDGIFSHISSKAKDTAMKELKPIELPSDDEIKEAAPYVPQDSHDFYYGEREGFKDGAKWMKEQILNQNK